jgi:1,4-dihydroxy-2-naphthoyl-CoA hydrolase
MKVAPEIKEKVERLLALIPQSLDAHLGIAYLELSPEVLVGQLPVDERTRQPFGILHGGASVVLAESLSSIGALLNINEERFMAVGLEINANHIRPVKEGVVIGTARPLHRGATTQIWETRIESGGKLVCVSRCTMAIVARR